MPPRISSSGRYCRLEPLGTADHADDLQRAFAEDRSGANWTYLGYGPFASVDEFRSWVASVEDLEDMHFYAIVDRESRKARGVASYLRMQPQVGVIEVGHINLAPSLQRTAAATEAMYLMMARIFDELGYRRYEWKCDELNARSIAAAQRLGFRYEGTFRQATIYKGRNRDTAWLSVLDREWPALRDAFETWLAPENFDEVGRQRRSLADVGRAISAGVGD